MNEQLLRKEINDAQRQIESLTRRAETAEAKANRASTRNQTLQTEYDKLKRELSSFQGFKEQLRKDLQSKTRRIQRQNEYITKLENRISLGVSDGALLKLNKKLRDDLAHANKTVDSLQTSLDMREQQLRELAKEVSILTTAAEMKLEELAYQYDQHGDAPLDMNYPSYDTVESSNKSTMMSLVPSSQLRHTLLYELSQTREAKKDSEQQLRYHQNLVLDLRNENEQLNQQMIVFKDQIYQAQRETETAKAQSYRYESEMQQLVISNKSLEQQNSTTRNELEKALNKLTETHAQLEERQELIVDLREQLKVAKESEALVLSKKEQVDIIQQSLMDASKQAKLRADEAEENIVVLERELVSYRALEESQSKELKELRVSNQNLQVQLQEIQENYTNMSQAFEQQRDELNQVRTQWKEIQNNTESSQQSLEYKYNETKSQLQLLQSTQTELTNRNAQLSVQCTELQDQNKRLQTALNGARQAKELMQTSLLNQIATLRGSNPMNTIAVQSTNFNENSSYIENISTVNSTTNNAPSSQWIDDNIPNKDIQNISTSSDSNKSYLQSTGNVRSQAMTNSQFMTHSQATTNLQTMTNSQSMTNPQATTNLRSMTNLQTQSTANLQSSKYSTDTIPVPTRKYNSENTLYTTDARVRADALIEKYLKRHSKTSTTDTTPRHNTNLSAAPQLQQYINSIRNTKSFNEKST